MPNGAVAGAEEAEMEMITDPRTAEREPRGACQAACLLTFCLARSTMASKAEGS